MGNGTSPVATKQCEVRWSHAALCSDVGQQWGHLMGAAHLGDVLQSRKQQPTKNQQYKLSFTVHIICTETFLVGFAAWVCQMLPGCVLARWYRARGNGACSSAHTLPACRVLCWTTERPVPVVLCHCNTYFATALLWSNFLGMVSPPGRCGLVLPLPPGAVSGSAGIKALWCSAALAPSWPSCGLPCWPCGPMGSAAALSDRLELG